LKAKMRHWINQNLLLNLLLKAEIKSTVSAQNLFKGEIKSNQGNNIRKLENNIQILIFSFSNQDLFIISWQS